MKRRIAFLFIVIVLLVSTIYMFKNPRQSVDYVNPIVTIAYDVTMKQDILCLMLAYPEHIKDIERGHDGKVYLVLKSGQKLVYDDEEQKSADMKMAKPDLQDMMEQPYPLDTTGKLMEIDFDPGRRRVYGLLKEVYGGSQQKVESNLGNVMAGGRSFRFNLSNGAGDALKAVMEELIPLAQNNHKVAAAVFPSSGAYNYRVIAGTNRLSPHAFGIAIDLARDSRDYWQWASREDGQKRLEAYPKEVVEIFEKNNFIWGGKWGHFDILHFEYRPEIIMKARYFGVERKAGDPWYKGAPEEARVKEIIDKIEERLNDI